jgi:hypothetical protein
MPRSCASIILTRLQCRNNNALPPSWKIAAPTMQPPRSPPAVSAQPVSEQASSGSAAAQDREARRAQALRANLRRRKDQDRARSTLAEADDEPGL